MTSTPRSSHTLTSMTWSRTCLFLVLSRPAANGLFLLSQAHQELTKREEQQQQAQAAQRESSSPTMTTTESTNGRRVTRTSVLVSNISTTTPAHKRKSESSDTGSTRVPPSANKRARNNTITSTSSTRSSGRRVSNARKRSDETDEDGSQDDDVSQDESTSPIERDEHSGIKLSSKKPETEEEKRRNFLERNRQGRFNAADYTGRFADHGLLYVPSYQLHSNVANARKPGSINSRLKSSTSLLRMSDCSIRRSPCGRRFLGDRKSVV